MSKRPITQNPLLALLLIFVFGAGLIASAQTNPLFTPLKAAKLIGMKVEDSDGQKAGAIRDLVVDTRSGQLKYVVVSSGGILGLRPTLKIAPSHLISAATAKRDTLAIDVSTSRWKHAPVFKSSRLATLAEPERAREVEQYFERGFTNLNLPGGHALSTTGYDNGKSIVTLRPQLKYARDLIGHRVVNSKQEKIGEILDLLVGFGRSRPAFAVLSTGGYHERQYAVGLAILSSTDDNDTWLLKMGDKALPQAPLFDQQAWNISDTSNKPHAYQYSKTDD